MKHSIQLLFIILIGISISMIASCKKKCKDPSNPECENYDPCYGKKTVSAAFRVFEATPSSSIKGDWYNDYETDTFVRNAYFIANEEGASYKWEIGAGVYHTRQVSLSFTGVDAGTVIPVTLIVEKEPDKKCHPNDDGRDTFTKYVTVTQHLNNQYFPMRPEVGETWIFETNDLDNPSQKWQFKFSNEMVDTVWFTTYRYFDNIPVGMEKKYGSTEVRGGIVGAKFRTSTYNSTSFNSKILLGMYYVDGVDYDFRLRYIPHSSNNEFKEFRFKAKRVQ